MKNDLVSGLAWGGGIVVLALAAKFAAAKGLIDNDTSERLVFGAIGLMVAWNGNRIPKKVVPSACARKAARVSGWAMVLSGLAYAGLWAFAPLDTAVIGGCAAILAGIAVTVFYCLRLRANAA